MSLAFALGVLVGWLLWGQSASAVGKSGSVGIRNPHPIPTDRPEPPPAPPAKVLGFRVIEDPTLGPDQIMAINQLEVLPKSQGGGERRLAHMNEPTFRDGFPETLYVQAGAQPSTPEEGRDFFGMARLETMNDGEGARDGETIAVYELKTVKTTKVTRELVDGET